MSGFYRFPALAGLCEFSNDEQLDHLVGESREAVDAYGEWEAEAGVPSSARRVCGSGCAEAKRAYGMELMDVIHAAETALRMEFGDDEVAELRDAVEAKNRKRGYYDER